MTVLVHIGCYNKTPIHWVAYKHQKFLTVLEPGSPTLQADLVSDEGLLPGS